MKKRTGMRLTVAAKPAAMGLLCFFAALLCMHPSASGQTTIYTNRAAFEAALQPGYYTETFDGAGTTGEVPSPQAFIGGSTNQFAYSIATQTGTSLFYATDPTDATMTDLWLGAFESDTSLVLTITTPNVMAIGGYFFLTSIVNTFPVEGTLTIGLNNGAMQSAGPLTTDTTFIGFTTTVPISSLVFTFTSAVPTTAYATINDLIVGTTVIPEPSSLALVAVGMAFGGAWSRLRKRQR